MSTLVSHVNKYTTSTLTRPSDDLDIYEFIDLCRILALSATYSQEVWEEGILAAADEITEERERESGGEKKVKNEW